jgi:hypothetical protein
LKPVLAGCSNFSQYKLHHAGIEAECNVAYQVEADVARAWQHSGILRRHDIVVPRINRYKQRPD